MLVLSATELKQEIVQPCSDSSFFDEDIPVIFTSEYQRMIRENFEEDPFFGRILEKLSKFSYPETQLLIYGGFLLRRFLRYGNATSDYDLDLALLFDRKGVTEEEREKVIKYLEQFLQGIFSFRSGFEKTSTYVQTAEINNSNPLQILNKIQVLTYPFISIEKFLTGCDFSLNSICYSTKEKVYYLTEDCLNSLRTRIVKLNFQEKAMNEVSPSRMNKYLKKGFAFLCPRLNLARLIEFFFRPHLSLIGVRRTKVLVKVDVISSRETRYCDVCEMTEPEDQMRFFPFLPEEDFYGRAYLAEGEKQFFNWNLPFQFSEFESLPGYESYSFFTQIWSDFPGSKASGGLRYLGSYDRIKKEKFSFETFNYPPKSKEEHVFSEGDFKIYFLPGTLFTDLKIRVFFRGKELFVVKDFFLNRKELVLFIYQDRCLIHALRDTDLNSDVVFRYHCQLLKNTLPISVFVNDSSYSTKDYVSSYVHYYNYTQKLKTDKGSRSWLINLQEAYFRTNQNDYSYAFSFLHQWLQKQGSITDDSVSLKIKHFYWLSLFKIYYHLGLLSYYLTSPDAKTLVSSLPKENPWSRYLSIVERIPDDCRYHVLIGFYLSSSDSNSDPDSDSDEKQVTSWKPISPQKLILQLNQKSLISHLNLSFEKYVLI